MRRTMGVRNAFQLIARRFTGFQRRHFCDSTSSTEKGRRVTSTSSNSSGDGKVGDIRDLDVYRDLDKLDFMKAAKILFTHPPKTKKFGLDFHLVQLFFVCMPSLAVFLVAQYARSEMRKMDAELDVKKKAEEEARQKEEAAAKEKVGKSASDLLEVKEKLLELEKTVNEIVVETRQIKPIDDSSGKTRPSNAAAKDQQPSAVSDPTQISRSMQELDVKKKAEEEARHKEEAAAKEKEGKAASDLLEVKEKLLELEKTVNEIVVETRQTKPTDYSSAKTRPTIAAAKD